MCSTRPGAIWSAAAPGAQIRLGDKVTVQVAKVDSFKKQVDFRLAAAERKSAATRPPSAPWKNSQSSESRPARPSAPHFAASQRPLLKSSGAGRSPKRRRYGN